MTASAPLPSGGSNLTEYRALLQVLGYASARKHDAASVVNDAVTGGVVCVFTDLHQRTPTPVVLPSARCVAVMAPLIARGFFAPSLTYTLDNPATTPYQPLAESQGRDAFTLLFILFPDCFVDARSVCGVTVAATTDDPLGEQADRSVSPHTSPGSRSRSSTPHAQVISTAVRSISATPNVSPSRTTRVDGGRSGSAPAASLGSPLASSTTTAGVAASTMTASPPPPPTPADVLELHRSRQGVALTYLGMMNDTLRDVQTRLLRLDRQAGVAASAGRAEEPPGGTAVGGPTRRAERANLQCVGNYTEKLKCALLACLCASEMAYRPMATQSGLGKLLEAYTAPLADGTLYENPSHAMGDPGRVRVGSKGGARDLATGEEMWLDTVRSSATSHPLVRPHRVLLAELGAHEWTRPVEQWVMWGQSDEEAGRWYDDEVARLSEAFQRVCGEPLEDFLTARNAAYVRQCAWPLCRAPTLLLYRATDGHGGVSMDILPPTYAPTPVPHMPIGAGELQELLLPLKQPPASTDGGAGAPLLFDAAPAPVRATLTRWAQRKLTEGQVRAESDVFFSVDTESPSQLADPASVQSVVRHCFAEDEQWLLRVLQHNPVLLARLVAWLLGRYGDKERSVARTAPLDAEECACVKLILDTALLHRAFSIPVGYFIRELVAHRALSKERFAGWLTACSERASGSAASGNGQEGADSAAVAAGNIKTLLALVTFVMASERWSNDPELRAQVEKLTQDTR